MFQCSKLYCGNTIMVIIVRRIKMRVAILILTGLLALVSWYANAAFSLSATRVIHHESMKESSFEVYNNGDDAILVQTWLDADGGDAPPFALTPPLVKINPNQHNLIRVFYQGSGLPKEKESLFWLNVLAIPVVVESEHTLHVALQQRIKLFYRPSGLPGDARSAPEYLRLLVKDNQLVVQNPTPYHVNISSFKQGGLEFDGDMLTPYGKIYIPAAGVQDSGRVEVAVINDFGAIDTFGGVLNSSVSEHFKLKR